jgi:alpha-ketoglutarate-dependent taurine dioxygenase
MLVMPQVVMPQADLKSRPAPHDWPFQVKLLHPVLGCEITGIALGEAVSPAIFAKIYEAFLTYQLILFHDVDLPPATQVGLRAQLRRGASPRAEPIPWLSAGLCLV